MIRGRRDPCSLVTCSTNSPTARLVMERHVQFVHRAIGFVDSPVDDAFIVEPQRVESLPASMEEVKHRPYPVPECVGLLGGEARAVQANTVYPCPSLPSSSQWPHVPMLGHRDQMTRAAVSIGVLERYASRC